MNELEEKIKNERKRHRKTELGTLLGGIAIIVIGIYFLLITPESLGMVQSLTSALYFGIGGSLLAKYTTMKRDLERSINEIKMNGKIDEVLSIIKDKTTIEKKEQQDRKITVSDNNFALILEEWRVVIQTQMHFNDLLMKIRTASISIVLVIFGAAGYSTLSKDTILLTIQDVTFHPSVLIVSAGLVILFSMFLIDYKYYYRLLVGAVKKGWDFDNKFENIDTWKHFGLTTTISKEIGEKTRGSGRFVICFYWIPFGAGVIFLLSIFLLGFPKSV